MGEFRMKKEKKLLGEKRREHVLMLLKLAHKPYTGVALSTQTGVSRQVIVQDIALLKAKNEPIVATPQGYLYMKTPKTQSKKRVVAVRHTPAETEKELNLLVDYGVKVLDVIVEHPFYGEIQGALMIQSREDVQLFLEKVKQTEAKLLSELTDGVHLHTLEGPSNMLLDKACEALEREGILLERD